MMANAQLREFSIQLQEESLRDLLDSLLRRRTDLAAEFQRSPAPDREYFEHLENEAADLNAWLVDMAELTMVAASRWVERELKAMAGRLPGQKPAETRTLRMGALVSLFKSAGLDLEVVARHREMRLLQAFANSWKHNAPCPSKEFLKEMNLAVPKADDPNQAMDHGLLSSETIEQRLREILGLTGDDVTCFDIARAMIGYAGEFLIGVAQAMPSRG